MDVEKQNSFKKTETIPTGGIDTPQRRALARLGLVSAAAYVSPTLLSLHSNAAGDSAAGGVGAAA